MNQQGTGQLYEFQAYSIKPAQICSPGSVKNLAGFSVTSSFFNHSTQNCFSVVKDSGCQPLSGCPARRWKRPAFCRGLLHGVSRIQGCPALAGSGRFSHELRPEGQDQPPPGSAWRWRWRSGRTAPRPATEAAVTKLSRSVVSAGLSARARVPRRCCCSRRPPAHPRHGLDADLVIASGAMPSSRQPNRSASAS